MFNNPFQRKAPAQTKAHPADHQSIGLKLDEIIAEMKAQGYWSAEPLPAEKYNFRKAFAIDTMAYFQWLQFVFVPRVQDVVAKKEPLPPSSSVGTQAIREFDGCNELNHLVSLLCEFDRLVRGQ